MTDTEFEAIAYAVGDTRLAGLFARIVDLQSENDSLTCEVDDLKAQIERLEREALC